MERTGCPWGSLGWPHDAPLPHRVHIGARQAGAVTAATAPHIALLPLDERPVNVLLPNDVARVAGYRLDVPPEPILPRYRVAGDTIALGAWLIERALDPATRHLVVSLDMLCYGGLIASRIGCDSTTDAVSRLDVLHDIRASRPELPISAVSLVMRASDSYSAAEEPGYWADFGRELHAHGASVHRGDDLRHAEAPAVAGGVPREVVSDFARRRIRNHTVNLAALELLDQGVIDFLAIAADDTAEFSAGSAEQEWLQHWMRLLPAGDSALMYPGADEVGAVLVARAVGADSHAAPVRIHLSCPEPGGWSRVPPYENIPLTESANLQIRAAGAVSVPNAGEADVVVVVHAPDPGGHDLVNGYPPSADVDAAARTTTAVESELEAGRKVAVADVRYPNGADPALFQQLQRAGALGRLLAFGAWNTAGNTVGGVVATAVAAILGGEAGHRDDNAVLQALLTRMLDDYAYQTVVRSEDGPALFPGQEVLDDERLARAEQHITRRLRHILATQLPAEGWQLERATLPWRRGFEVGLSLRLT